MTTPPRTVVRAVPRRRVGRGISALALLALGLAFWGALPGCLGPAPELEGGSLHHHNWWNYYVRGTVLLKQGQVEEAAADFERALGVRPGAKFGFDRDLWRARTYGLHFVEGYFPHRELGVCLYEQGDLDRALSQLETSLRQEPSGRAKHYLNLVRRKQLLGGPVPLPSLRLEQAEGQAFTRERSLAISGRAEGVGRIARLSIAGRTEFIELAEPVRAFSRAVPLVAGANRIEVVAEDLAGQRVVRQVDRVADWTPPQFVVRSVERRGDGWWVDGVCRDEHGVDGVAVDGRVLFRGGGGAGAEPERNVAFTSPSTGSVLTAMDRAGNEMVCVLDAAGFAQIIRNNPPEWVPARDSEPWRIQWASTQAVAPATPVDRLRPALTLRGCQAVTRVYSDEFFVDGTASDGGGLSSVTLNGESLLATGDVGAVRTYFARRIPLDMGTNHYEVATVDRSGNRTSQELMVIRSLPEYLEERYRLSVGVPPLLPESAGLVRSSIKRSMELQLTRDPVRFRLLERDEGWDFVLREQGLSVSDLADPSAALRIGKLVPAELLLMGRIYDEAKGVTLFVKAVETGHGEVVFASDVYSPDTDRALPEAVEGLVLKVVQGFPMVSGEVLRCQGDRVTLNVGRHDGTLEHSRFLVVAPNGSGAGSDTESGQVCKVADAPVQVQVERVQDDTSTARIVPSSADTLVKEGYHVYTR